jgi:hypothetical protein
MDKQKDIGYCEVCRKQFGYSLIHNGFNDSAYAYCDACGMTALLSGWYENIPETTDIKFHQVIAENVEPFLKDCKCGGKFRKNASPRCPHCNSELSAIEATKYIEQNALGTKQGWRWQQNWQGLYCIIIENKCVTDNWK